MTFPSCRSGLAGSSGSTSKTSRAAPPTRPERLDQGRLVHDQAARGVDEDRGWLHPGEPPGVDQVARLLRQEDVQRDDVGLAQELLEDTRRTPSAAAVSAAT